MTEAKDDLDKRVEVIEQRSPATRRKGFAIQNSSDNVGSVGLRKQMTSAKLGMSKQGSALSSQISPKQKSKGGKGLVASKTSAVLSLNSKSMSVKAPLFGT